MVLADIEENEEEDKLELKLTCLLLESYSEVEFLRNFASETSFSWDEIWEMASIFFGAIRFFAGEDKKEFFMLAKSILLVDELVVLNVEDDDEEGLLLIFVV